MPPLLPRAGTILDATYRLDALLGQGGAGAVFRATHLGLQKAFAIKVFLPPPGKVARFFEQFRVEAEALGRLDHPGIVRVTDFGIDPQGDGLPYLVMELVDGTTLDARCARPMPLAQAAPILDTIAAAIDAAHQAGIVHGDVTTRNVMIASVAGGEHPTLIDFGLARIVENDVIPMFGLNLAGTGAYLAPELVQGDRPTADTDIYAFGVLAYRVLTGQYPFAGPLSDVLNAHVTQTLPAPSAVVRELPADVDEAISSALTKSPQLRPRTAAEIADRLSRAARTIARKDWRRREMPRRAAAAALVAVAVAALDPMIGALGIVRRIEGITFDARVRWSTPRAADPRLLLVSFDDRSLAADSTPLPDRADEVGTHLARLMDAGASVLGIDLLLPAHWGQSRAFAELVLRHAPRLALAVAQEGDARVGPEAIGGLVAGALGPDAARGLFASVNVEPDLDGVVRSARVFRVASDGARQPTMAARLAGWPDRPDLAGEERVFPVDYRLDRQSVERISWIDLEAQLRERPHAFERRLVIVGAEFAGSGDRHLAPRPGGPPADVTGLEQQAIIAASLLASSRLSEPDGWRRIAARVWLVLISTGIALAALLRIGIPALLTTTAGAMILWAGTTMFAFANGVVLPVAAPLTRLVLVFFVAAAWSRFWSRRPDLRGSRGASA